MIARAAGEQLLFGLLVGVEVVIAPDCLWMNVRVSTHTNGFCNTIRERKSFETAFVRMCCQDMSGSCHAADFDYFEYRERDFRPNPFSNEPSKNLIRREDI